MTTAFRDAANDGNPATAGDPTWTPLLLKVADPSYPGAHSAISGAGAAVLSSVFGAHDRITVTSDVLPGVVRTFDSYSAAATEAGLSRIFGGVHTRIDHEVGLRLGQGVARFVLEEARSPSFGLRGTWPAIAGPDRRQAELRSGAGQRVAVRKTSPVRSSAATRRPRRR